MLNRRNLRMKAVQYLYGYLVSYDANYELAKDYIKDAFLPDLNSPIQQDYKKLQEYSNTACTLFDEKMKEVEYSSELTPEFRRVIENAIIHYRKLNKLDEERVQKDLLNSVDSIYDHFLLVLKLSTRLYDICSSKLGSKSPLLSTEIPQKFDYQALLLDIEGNTVDNGKYIRTYITITDSDKNSYKNQYIVSTNEFGLFSVTIRDITGIDWSLPTIISVEADIKGNKLFSRSHQETLIIPKENLISKKFASHLKVKSVQLPDSKDLEVWSMLNGLCKDILLKDEVVIAYFAEKVTTIEQDKDFIVYLTREHILKNVRVVSFFEDLDGDWDETKEAIKGLLKKIFKNAIVSQELSLLDSIQNKDALMPEMSPNWVEDREYLRDLFAKALRLNKQLEEIITPKLKKWDFDRIEIIDNVILKLAVCEMLYFDSIPVKVTINEFLEVAKIYGTPEKSKFFINGVLDSLSEEYINDGTIKKTGRGLIDNK